MGSVYILASKRNGTLYVGVTSDLVRRVWQHREAVVESFTKTYGVKRLVWYEVHHEIVPAITREKQIKQWNRLWKIRLIHKTNPFWNDLFDEIVGRHTGYGFPPPRRAGGNPYTNKTNPFWNDLFDEIVG
jgi:putative endonuclease